MYLFSSYVSEFKNKPTNKVLLHGAIMRHDIEQEILDFNPDSVIG